MATVTHVGRLINISSSGGLVTQTKIVPCNITFVLINTLFYQ